MVRLKTEVDGSIVRDDDKLEISKNLDSGKSGIRNPESGFRFRLLGLVRVRIRVRVKVRVTGRVWRVVRSMRIAICIPVCYSKPSRDW